MTARRIGAIGRGRALAFSFDGRSYTGCEGDTIASALMANNVRIIGRSFKYHRPRGIYGAWTEEPNAILDVTEGGRTTPNTRATTEPLRDGMILNAGHASPGAADDRLGFLDRLARFIPAGFYYKTFIWPNWHVFEPRIRALSGLGRLDPHHQPPADNPQINAACDILVIGAGPAGLAAARAAPPGRRVMIVDDQTEPGGTLLHREAAIDGEPGRDWARRVSAELCAAGCTMLAHSTAYGVYQHNLVCVWQRREGAPDALWRIRAGQIILAAGAIERPQVFPDNDRPGVMSAEAALIYLRRYGILVGEQIFVALNNSAAEPVAAALSAAGASVRVADARRGEAVTGVRGARGVEQVAIGGIWHEADCLLVSGGFSPTVHLFCQAAGKLRFDATLAALVPGDPIAGMAVIGAAAGRFDLGDLLADAHRTAGGSGAAPTATAQDAPYAIAPVWPQPGGKGRQWIDFQNDVTLKDIELAARENFRAVEHLKRYTTLGMANDQGKTANLNGLAAMAAITGRSIAETGTTTYRPPFVPVPFGVIAGRRRGELFNPVRRLVLEPAHRAAGATFREYGGWLRPAYYGAGAAEARIEAEALMARTSVGLIDASPLGKIEIFGPQAGALIDFVCYHTLSTLKPGRLRYAFMLTEAGVIDDDGVIAKVSDEHYIVSCSSGHVPGVTMRLEEARQDRFDPARVLVHNSTAQWATLTMAGPKARAAAASLGLGIALDDDALPPMAFCACKFGDDEARIARVSFTGERSYEISVPAQRAESLFSALAAAVSAVGGGLIGSEALLILRAEKGYIIAGKDTDGTTGPQDLGVTGPRDRRADEFVGKRALFTEHARRADRQQLVGLAVDGGTPLPTGAHAVETRAGVLRSIGFVTSSYFSPILGRPIALALIERGLTRIGEAIDLVHLGARLRAVIAPACALDPEGRRLHA